MKKILKISVAVLGILLLGALFSSCEKNASPQSKMVRYVAEGNASGSSITTLFLIASFQAAIDNAVGNGFVQENDAKVIAACDAYHNTILYEPKLQGTINITKTPMGGTQSTIKTYIYNNK